MATRSNATAGNRYYYKPTSAASDGLGTAMQDWRTDVLNHLLPVICLLASPALLNVVFSTDYKSVESMLGLLLFGLLYIGILLLTIWRNLGPFKRSWGLMGIIYCTSLVAFWRAGLVGDGLLYLLLLNVLAMMLLNTRSGMFFGVLSILTYLSFLFLFQQKLIGAQLIFGDNPLDIRFWVINGITLVSGLLVIIFVNSRSTDFQLQVLKKEQQASDQLATANQELSEAYDATLQGWSNALELRERETAGHSQRVVELTLQLAEKLGASPEQLINIRRGAYLHDIGKIGIPDSILLKPGPLTAEEWQIMRQHPVYAQRLLAPIAFLRDALDIPSLHHERWNGSGYPLGLKGERIPQAARIFMVVDVWDALISDRPYRAAWSAEKTRAYLHENAGTLFDPWVVEAFLALTETGG
jgi:hypothetical protein